ncbi:4877_t:CDS:2 [Acaulospora morrowiae]|uniref:4877_t:CDS:1 n=1 Tax=Acaulospora morrowiae TaxID=94023 RepID=A0A9N9BKX1_9GLOM|nr:4877_t:CDS:2 [Acaulospora morrowiae]
MAGFKPCLVFLMASSLFISLTIGVVLKSHNSDVSHIDKRTILEKREFLKCLPIFDQFAANFIKVGDFSEDAVEKVLYLDRETSLRKVLLFYNPNSSTKSRNLYEWALENYLQPSIDHVFLVSVINIPRVVYPAPEMLWSFGLKGYGNVINTYDHRECLSYLKSKEDSVRNILEKISCELRCKNITSCITIERGNGNGALLDACESIKPDVILIGSSKKCKRKFEWISNNSLGIPVITYDDDKMVERKDENTRILNKGTEDKRCTSKNCEENLISQKFVSGTNLVGKRQKESRQKVCGSFSEQNPQWTLQSLKCKFSFPSTPRQKNYCKLKD